MLKPYSSSGLSTPTPNQPYTPGTPEQEVAMKAKSVC